MAAKCRCRAPFGLLPGLLRDRNAESTHQREWRLGFRPLALPLKEARDAMFASGMELGVAAGYDRLAELLASTPARGDS